MARQRSVDGDELRRHLQPAAGQRLRLVGRKHHAPETFQGRRELAGDQAAGHADRPGQARLRAEGVPQLGAAQGDVQVQREGNEREQDQPGQAARLAQQRRVGPEDEHGKRGGEQRHGDVVGQAEAVHEGERAQGALAAARRPEQQQQEAGRDERQVQGVGLDADRPPPGRGQCGEEGRPRRRREAIAHGHGRDGVDQSHGHRPHRHREEAHPEGHRPDRDQQRPQLDQQHQHRVRGGIRNAQNLRDVLPASGVAVQHRRRHGPHVERERADDQRRRDPGVSPVQQGCGGLRRRFSR